MSEFSTRVNQLVNEVTRLKTSHAKTAMQLKTKSASLNISLLLKMGTGGYSVYAEKTAIVTCTAADGNNFLSSFMLNQTSLDGRTVTLQRRTAGTGAVQFAFTITAGNYSDYTTISGGGSVTVNYSVNVIGTSDFSTVISYETNSW